MSSSLLISPRSCGTKLRRLKFFISAIFRSQPIVTLGDLKQIGLHNKIEKTTKKLNLDFNNRTQRLNDSVEDLQEKMQTNKNVLFGKKYVKIRVWLVINHTLIDLFR